LGPYNTRFLCLDLLGIVTTLDGGSSRAPFRTHEAGARRVVRFGLEPLFVGLEGRSEWHHQARRRRRQNAVPHSTTDDDPLRADT
jgi:hypothetical protein